MTLNGPKRNQENSIPRPITRTAEFDSAIMEIAKDYKRLDIIDNAIDWGLARAPSHLFTRAFKNYYFWVTEATVASPQLRLLFEYTDSTDTVHLVAAELIPDTHHVLD